METCSRGHRRCVARLGPVVPRAKAVGAVLAGGLLLLGGVGNAAARSWELNGPAWHLPTPAHSRAMGVPGRAPASGFAGSWQNVDRNTRGLTRVDIVRAGAGYRVRAWGRCHPRDCDWGSAPAQIYAPSPSARRDVALTAQFREPSGTMTLVLHNRGSRLSAEVFRAFDPAHASGRRNYLMTAQLTRSATRPSVGMGGAAPSGSGGTRPPAGGRPAGAQARFRVIVTGFTVNQQTWDDALNHDGKGDEVFLLTHVAELSSSGKEVLASNVRSRVMGDTNGWKGRVHAGTAWTGIFGGPRGGLATGDQYPSTRPWQVRGRVFEDRAPELVWQGTLRRGDGGVLIVPTIWEWDEAGGDAIVRDWAALVQKLDKAAGPLINAASGGATKPFVDATGATWGVLRSNELARVLGHAATRPIGLREAGKGRQVFRPTIIRLNYDIAERLLHSNFGKGPGVLEVQYQDSSRLRGDYTLYVKVQRM